MWGSWTPAKVKMAVSGCPRNCAEATCKDVGVICVDSGYEIHFAGAAGLDIKGTRSARPRQDARTRRSKIIVALVQLYREQGRYLERIYKWTKRVGVDEIRRQIVDDTREAQGAISTASSSRRNSRRSIPWSERVSRQGQARVQADGDHRFAGGGVRSMTLDRHRRARPTFRAAARAASSRRSGRIAVFRTADDHVFALEDRCPHKGRSA